MEKRYDYLVRDWGKGLPTLIRLSCFSPWEADIYVGSGVWKSMPHLNDIRVGKGCYMDYDDISEEKAMELMEKIREEDERKAAGKTEKGI